MCKRPVPIVERRRCDGTAGTSWVNGNLGASKSFYSEGDSVPYRLRFGNLSLSSHVVTIEWDTTKSSKHALDYITTFNRTVGHDANPIVGVAGHTLGTFDHAIPADPPGDRRRDHAASGRLPDLRRHHHWYRFRISYPNGSGFPGDKTPGSRSRSRRRQQPGARLGRSHRYPGRLGRRRLGGHDLWLAIPHAPHRPHGAGGNQDRSLSTDAVIFPGSITIIKDVVWEGPGGLRVLDDRRVVADDLHAGRRLKRRHFPTRSCTQGSPASRPIRSRSRRCAHWSVAIDNCTVTSPNGGTQVENNGTRTVTIASRRVRRHVRVQQHARRRLAGHHHQVKNDADDSNIANGGHVAIGTVVYDTALLHPVRRATPAAP